MDLENFQFFRASEDEDVRDEIWDGDEDVRGRQISEIIGTSEDKDVDVLRRPAWGYLQGNTLREIVFFS